MAGRTTLSDLPAEVLHRIFTHLSWLADRDVGNVAAYGTVHYLPEKERPNRRALLSLCVTNRHIGRAASVELYRVICPMVSQQSKWDCRNDSEGWTEMPGEWFKRLAVLARDKPHLLSQTRVFLVDMCNVSPHDITRVISALERLQAVIVYTRSYLAEATAHLPPMLSKLGNLRHICFESAYHRGTEAVSYDLGPLIAGARLYDSFTTKGGCAFHDNSEDELRVKSLILRKFGDESEAIDLLLMVDRDIVEHLEIVADFQYESAEVMQIMSAIECDEWPALLSISVGLTELDNFEALDTIWPALKTLEFSEIAMYNTRDNPLYEYLFSTIPSTVTKLAFRIPSADLQALRTLHRLLDRRDPSLANITQLAFDTDFGHNLGRYTKRKDRPALVEIAGKLEELAKGREIALYPGNLRDSVASGIRAFEMSGNDYRTGGLSDTEFSPDEGEADGENEDQDEDEEDSDVTGQDDDEDENAGAEDDAE